MGVGKVVVHRPGGGRGVKHCDQVRQMEWVGLPEAEPVDHVALLSRLQTWRVCWDLQDTGLATPLLKSLAD